MAHVIHAGNRFLIRRYCHLRGFTGLIVKASIVFVLRVFKPKVKDNAPIARRLKSGRKVIKEGNHYTLSTRVL